MSNSEAEIESLIEELINTRRDALIGMIGTTGFIAVETHNNTTAKAAHEFLKIAYEALEVEKSRRPTGVTVL